MKTREEIERIGIDYGFYSFRSCVMGKELRYVGPKQRFHCFGYSIMNAGEKAEYAFDGATSDSDFKVYNDRENPHFQPMEEEDFILMYPQYFITPLDYAIVKSRKSKKPFWVHK